MPSTLAYWDIRGLGAPIRLLLAYAGEDFEDKHYSCGEAPDYDKSGWFGEKPKLGLDFPNLPYYKDEVVSITQSNAILRYLARKHNLYGSTPKQQAMADLMAEEAMDFRNGLVRLCYNPTAKERLPAYLEGVKPRLDSYEKFLGEKPFFTGDTVTFPDFHMFELFDQHRILFDGSLQNYPKINAFMERFRNLPKVKEYYNSPKHIKLPINNKMAPFGGKVV